jgi:hypothetical protein
MIKELYISTNPAVSWLLKQGAIVDKPTRPVLVLITLNNDSLRLKLQEHYSDRCYKRWSRLEEDMAWIYNDTYFVFTKWDRLWGAVKDNMRHRVMVSAEKTLRRKKLFTHCD